MKNLILLLIVIVLQSCNSSGDNPPATIANIIQEPSNTSELDEIAQILEEENNFEYELKQIGPFDYQSSARIALNRLNSNNEQESILWQKGANNIIELNIVNLSSNNQNLVSTQINDSQFHALRRNYQSDDMFLITKKPISIYNVQSNGTSTKISDLFTHSNIVDSKRQLNKISQTMNRLCGYHNNTSENLFLKTADDSFQYFTTQQAVKSVYCLEGSLLVINTSNDYYLINQDGEIKLFEKLDPNCPEGVNHLLRQDGFYIRCYYRDSQNKKRYTSYLVDEINQNVVQGPIGPAIANPTLPYLVKQDIVTTQRSTANMNLHYRLRSATQWKSISVASQGAAKKIQHIQYNAGELELLSYYASYKITENNGIEKTSYSFHPKLITDTNAGRALVLANNGNIFEVNKDLATNDYLKKLLNNIDAQDLNPVPFLTQTDKLSVIKALRMNDSTIINAQKKGNVNRISKVNLDGLQEEYASFAAGSVIKDMASNESLIASITINSSNQTILSLFDQNLNLINSIELDFSYHKYSQVSFVHDGILVSARRKLVKYNFNLEQEWLRDISGVTSNQVLSLESGHYLGVYNNHIVTINNEDGLFEELYPVNNLGFSLVYELVLVGQDLYINYKGGKVLKIKLPLSKLKYKGL